MMDQNTCFAYLNMELPDDIRRLKEAGYYDAAIARIDACLAEDWTASQNQPLHPQGVVGQLLHPQQDDATVGVGKGGIGLPDAPGQPAGGQLGLQAVVFPVTADLLEVKHGMSPSF